MMSRCVGSATCALEHRLSPPFHALHCSSNIGWCVVVYAKSDSNMGAYLSFSKYIPNALWADMYANANLRVVPGCVPLKSGFGHPG